MLLTSVSLRSFRCFDSLDLPLEAGLNLLAGPNGVGKTTVLEAIYVALTGTPLRHGGPTFLVACGKHSASVVLRFTTEPRDAERSYQRSLIAKCTPNRVSSLLDAVPLSRTDLETLRPPLCVFTPARAEIVRGSPGFRRSHFDALLSALNPSYAQLIRRYGICLQQRTAALSTAPDRHLDAWDEQLAALAHEIHTHRSQLVQRLVPFLERRAHALGLTGVYISYRPHGPVASADDCLDALRAARSSDRLNRRTSVGPHRSDFAFELAGLPARTAASQGQQRLIAIALLLAEGDLLAASRGRAPLFLFDDALSELDPHSAELVLTQLSTTHQSLLTATHAPPVQQHSSTTLIDLAPLNDPVH